jgi:hypothetical protein
VGRTRWCGRFFAVAKRNASYRRRLG